MQSLWFVEACQTCLLAWGCPVAPLPPVKPELEVAVSSTQAHRLPFLDILNHWHIPLWHIPSDTFPSDTFPSDTFQLAVESLGNCLHFPETFLKATVFMLCLRHVKMIKHLLFSQCPKVLPMKTKNPGCLHCPIQVPPQIWSSKELHPGDSRVVGPVWPGVS